MAISVLSRPHGFILDPTERQVEVIAPLSGNAAQFQDFTHGLIDDQVIYIKSRVIDYCGFWRVHRVDADYFTIREYIGAPDVSFVKAVQNPDFDTFYVASSASNWIHGWNCVHLPIVYKLSNTLWPSNSEDTVRTMSSVTDSNGYCALSISGDIKSTGSAAALEFVKITGATDDDLNGVWQIISYTNDTTFTVNIPYSAANDTALTNASIQYYYNNYHAKVQIWGGLNNGHIYYAQEPYELIATLDLIPDDNNEILFSVSEYLKKNIEIKNNLQLGTLPNNLDAFTMFFIKYAEVYDDSDGTTLSQTTPSYTSDLTSFEGRAVNAKLPFKGINSGSLSEYISATSSQLFLTNFTNPVLFEGKYFDLSFLWDGINNLYSHIQTYLNGALVSTSLAVQDCFYTGVYRIELDEDYCDTADEIQVRMHQVTPVTILAPSSWTDLGTAFDSKTSTSLIDNFNLGQPAKGAYMPLSMNTNDIIDFTLSIVLSGSWAGNGTVTITAGLRDNSTVISQTVIQTDASTFTANNTYSLRRIIRADAPATRFFIQLTTVGPGNTGQVIITPQTIYLIDGDAVSETKTISIDCNCTRSKAQTYYLSWMNNLGGFDYWLFTGYADEITDIVDTVETEENIFTEWPKSYGEFADTIRKQTSRTSRDQVLIRSQHLTEAQVAAIKRIKASPLVQIVNSIYDRRTVIVDADSFTSFKESENLHELSFTITYTDDVPSQSV